MMQIFNREGRGAEEIVKAVGMIASDVSFDKWEPLLPLGVRDVAAIIGREPIEALAEEYMAPTFSMSSLTYRAVALLQQAVAFFTWLKLIPTLDAQHDNAGRGRRLGENEKGLTALEQFKDEENILHLAYEAVDALVEELEDGRFAFWKRSPKYMQRKGLLLTSKSQFDNYYVIGSHRLYVTLLPMIREVQDAEVLPIVGIELMNRMLSGDGDVETFAEVSRRITALLAMKKAVERLPVEVLPTGIVQVQQSQPIKQRLKAEKEARQCVAASLAEDASRYIQRLADMVQALNGKPATYVRRPIVHSKGMSF